MSDKFYTDLRDLTVDPLMDQFGFAMVLRSSREPTIDPDTGAVISGSTHVDTPVTGLFRFYSQDELTSKDILANDIQCLIGGAEVAAVGIEPDTTMQVIAKGSTYNVVRVTPTQPGGVSVLYRLQIRK
jgi:hypothetical protein